MSFVKHKFRFLFLAPLVLLFACSGREQVDLIVHHARVYTVDGGNAKLESFAVRDGKIVAVGTNESIAAMYKAYNELHAEGKTILPGLIDAHCHFLAYGKGTQECDLMGTKSFAEMIERVKKYAATNKRPWIVGRGWDQNDWADKTYPDRAMLDSLFPRIPVLLKRIDGHAALANGEALRRAKVTDSLRVTGGELLRREDGSYSGILIDNGVEVINRVIPAADAASVREALLRAQQDCFALGITSITEAGLMKSDIDAMDALQQKGDLKMRIYAMLSDSAPNYAWYMKQGPYKTDRLHVRSFKFYGDGALGSRGACLLQPYSDLPDHSGFFLESKKHYEEKFKLLASKGFQINTHCIGDSANRFFMQLYGQILSQLPRTDTTLSETDFLSKFRWRIEHAQVVNPADLILFERWKIIPSVQPTHATSDMYWAGARLGEARLAHAYTYKSLLARAGVLPLGTDFPVERIEPMNTFYAAVARQDLKGFPEKGFQMGEALSRLQTLRGMTIDGAYAAFEENEKGSLEPGKFADFVILDNDPMTCEISKIPSIKVLATYSNGELVYKKP